MNTFVLIPIYNDWEAVQSVALELDHLLSGASHQIHIVLVDDSSTEAVPSGFLSGPFDVIADVTILRLRCNLGHQRAIAVGLTWIQKQPACDVIVVMDGDGEDKPSDVRLLLDTFIAAGGTKAVFAERLKRSEGFVFTFFYGLYRLAHRLLTGLPVRIGNFSALPVAFAHSLVASNYLWHHYAATVVRIHLDFQTIPTERGHRYCGTSKMNFVSLVRHGLSAIAVHSEVVGVRMLIACGIVTIWGIAALAACVLCRFFTDLAVPGWATYVSGIIVIIVLQVLSITFSFTMRSISDHNNGAFVPLRDCSHYLLTCRAWRPKQG